MMSDDHGLLPRLATDLKTTRQAIDRVRKAVEQASQGRALLIAPNLSRIRDQITMLHQASARLAAIEPPVIDLALQDAVAEARLRVQRDFEEAVESRGLTLTGQWPNYTIEHLITVRFDATHQRVLVGVTQFRSLDLDAPLKFLSGLVDEIRTRQFNPTEFVPALNSAYGATIESKRRKAGDVVPIIDVFKRMRQGRSYRPELFGIDLSHALRSADNSPIRLSPARSPRGAIYVPDSRGGTYVSGLRITQLS